MGYTVRTLTHYFSKKLALDFTRLLLAFFRFSLDTLSTTTREFSVIYLHTLFTQLNYLNRTRVCIYKQFADYTR